MKSYNDELFYMLETCSDWDVESKALKEAFDMGIDFQKKRNAVDAIGETEDRK